LPYACGKALLTERTRDAQSGAESAPICFGQEFSLFGFCRVIAKTNVLN